MRDKSEFAGRYGGGPVMGCRLREHGVSRTDRLTGMAVGGSTIPPRKTWFLRALAGVLLVTLATPLSAPIAEPRYGAGYGSGDAAGSPPPSPAVIDGWRADTSTQGDSGQHAGSDDDDVRAMLDEASAAQARGHLERAQQLLEQVIAKAPGAPEAMVARRRLGAIYRGEVSVSAPHFSSARETDSAVSGTPLPELPGPQRPGSIDADASGIRPADLDADALATRGAADAREAAMSTTVSPQAADVFVSPQPWRAQARPSPRFEQLLRTDVGDRIFFATGSAQIGTRARSVLESQADWLARYPDLYVVVEGHSDEPGSEADNDAIARQRAETARRLLIGVGMKADRLDIDVRGRRDPVATCESSDCRSQNRRAVIRLMVVLPPRPGDHPSLNQVPFDQIAPR